MENAASYYVAKQFIDFLTGKVRPDAVTGGRFLALFTTNPAPGNTGTELSGGSYARKTCAASFTAITSGQLTASNTSAITFTTATGNWSTAYYWALFDASSGGNLITWGWIPQGITVLNGQTLTFPIGSIVVSLT